MIDFVLNSIALVTTVGSVWLCTNPGKKNPLAMIRLGCLFGIVGCSISIYLQINGAPWSALGLSIFALICNIRGANLPGLFNRLRASK